MSSILRSALEIGPAKFTAGGHTFYSKGADLVIDPQYVKLATDRHGSLDSRITDMLGKVTVTPDGAWTAASRAALWPYASTSPGASLGTGDPTLVIHCNDSAGTRYTGKCAILTQMPQLLLSAKASMIGQAEYTLIRADNQAPSAADQFLLRDAAAFSDATFTVASLKTQAYTGAYGGVLTGIETEDGWTVNFSLSLQPKLSDRYGTIDFRFADLEVAISGIPINISVEDILAAIRSAGATGWTAGQSMQAAGQAFTLTGEDSTVAITIPNVFAERGQFRFGATDYRQGGITFASTRTLSAGANVALFTLA